MTKTYVLYGVANRDPNELVCQFFSTWDELWDFVRDLPGRYASMKLFGVKPDDFSVFGHLVLSEGLTTEALKTYRRPAVQIEHLPYHR